MALPISVCERDEDDREREGERERERGRERVREACYLQVMHRHVIDMEDIAPNQTQSLSLSHVAKFRRGPSLSLILQRAFGTVPKKERERKKRSLSLMREYQTLLPLH